MQLFQVAAVLRPTDEEAKSGKLPTLIMEPKWKFAASEQAAAILAGRDLPDDIVKEKMSYVDVIVRPF